MREEAEEEEAGGKKRDQSGLCGTSHDLSFVESS